MQKFNMKTPAGSIESSAGAFWPYRLITGLFTRLRKSHPERLFVETETPVTQVEHNNSIDRAFPYLLTTPRGQVRATHVIYCTNGWSSHILPGMRGKIYPLRGTMSTQAASSEFPRQGDHRSWSTVRTPSYDLTTNTINAGLYYITQHAQTGDIFIGGENSEAGELFRSDDSTMSPLSKHTLENKLPQIYAQGWTEDQKPEIRKVWSGIMGFTPDFMPWVGRLPSSITHRQGDGEWIAAGFNGFGMPLCWGCGEAIAKMILGQTEEVEEWLPKSFLTSSNRLKSPFSTPEVGIAIMLEQIPALNVIARLVGSWVIGKGSELFFGMKDDAVVRKSKIAGTVKA